MNLPTSTSTEREQQRLLKGLARLAQISLTLNSTLDPDDLLKYIALTAAEVLGCEAVSILLYDDKKEELRFAASTSTYQKELEDIPVPLDQSIAGTIFRENRPLLIHDVATDERHYKNVGEQVKFQTRSLLGVPMPIKEKVTGVMEALNKRENGFNEIDVYLLSIFAAQAAVAIQNARLVRALQDAYAEMSRVDRIKTNFLALASHELRTPLMVIMGYASFLREEAQGELSEHAAMVLDSALRMRTVLETMNNVDMVRTGTLDFFYEPLVLQSVINAACAEVKPLMDERRQTLTCLLPEEPLMLKGDAEKLHIAFANILNNASRFTPQEGSVLVRLTAQPEKALIEIRDTGIGIAPEHLEHIFEEFYQAENHLVRTYGGLGLGLTVARGVVNLHEGSIWAESPGVGKGTTLFVALPRNTE